MKLYESRDKISAGSSLSEAYKMLLAPDAPKLLPEESESQSQLNHAPKPSKFIKVESADFSTHFSEFAEIGVTKNAKQKYGFAKNSTGLQPAIFYSDTYYVYRWESLVELIR
jgi:hypothetical protein